ncbi:calmodulin-regulated spectrin-associated protein 2-like isoform X4 [Orbicella faveolata]|uniref:calmodulin-regulated spectrin-associated protein 2-like isoform X4 n=1 Tax=Orbicella faveolata TaxID=48498 RepID=UPI0009E3475A|nr:calmodulin-regulated spectrin-associated protein 2-like isoform X4 [Orbicella faveolata]
MDDVKVENVPYNVIPVTEYDPFEAKFAASLYWLVFRATEDGEFDDIPSQVTSPIQRDSEKRITVRPEVTEFLTNGVIYCKVCDSIFDGKVPVVGQWALLQTLSRHGFYVVEEGDIAVTDSALQQKKPFRKSTHLALMDCLMNAFSSRMVTVQQVIQSVSNFSSFNASKELPFDLEDALLLWMNKICAALNDNQLKRQKQHAEQLLQNQDKAKRFRFRRDQLQPKVQTAFPMMEELLNDISDGKSLLGIIMFYHPKVINLEDVHFDKDLSTEDCVRNLDLFRSLCSQLICTSVLALKVEDLLYGSQAMKPNVVALLAEIFHKCEIESLASENGVEKQTSKSDVDLRYIVANKENVVDNKSSSAPVLSSDKFKSVEHRSSRESFKSERSSSISGQINSSASDPTRQENSYAWKSQSDGQVNSNSRLSFKSPFHLDFTVDNDLQQPPLNGHLLKEGNDKENVLDKGKDKENPFSGILQRPVLAGDSRKHNLTANLAGGYGSPRATPRQEVPLLMRRNKQKQRTLDLEEWDMQQEEVEELQLNDLQRSQSLTGLDKAKVEPRQSFHAWREDTGASLSDSNLASSRNERISLDFRPNPTSSVPQRTAEGGTPRRGTQGIHVPVTSSGLKTKRDEHTSQDSLSSSPKSTDSLNMRPSGDKPRERQHFAQSVVRDSCTSDISTKELNQFEEIEAMILAGKSVETPRKFVRASKLPSAPASQDEEDELNTSVSSEDMNKFRLEVLQRLTEDKLREIPDGAEMEDDDDPILLARNNAVSSPRNPPEQRTRLDVPDPPAEVPTDQLSPITETTEPCPSVASNPNSVSSANSTAPSSPCSPLDVAPFMPAFFTTSPANTLDRKNQRLKEREDSERTLVAEDDDAYTKEPETSATPRFQTMPSNKYRDFSTKSKSFEQLARGSYTVGQVSVESAQALGIPVINARAEEIRARAESLSSQSAYPEPSDFRVRSHQETNSSADLSGLRPLVLSSGGGDSNEAFPAEGVDGRRDSLESSPLPSPAFARGKRDDIRGQRDDTRPEAAFRPRDMTAQDSPGDVVIFERSLSNSHGAQEDPMTASENLNPQTNENEQRNSVTVSRAKKSEAYVFDFNQEVVQHYENDPAALDFRTYKKGKRADLADGSNLPQGNQAFQGSQRDGQCATFGENGHGGTQEHRPASQERRCAANEFAPLDGTHSRHVYEENPSAGVYINELRPSDGFSTYRKETEPFGNNGAAIAEATEKGLNLRHSDGFSTFRKETEATASESLSAQFRTIPVHGQREIEAEQYATFAKSVKKHDGSQFRAEEEFYHPPDLEILAVAAVGPLPSRGGEGQMYTAPRRREEEQARISSSSNITRSRTFRKKPDGQIIECDDVGTNSSPRQYEESVSTNSASKPTGEQSINAHIRASPEGAGSDNPHRISWTDESEAGARPTRHSNASVDRSQPAQESPGPSSPRRRGSPRHTGRGSPGARISWLTAAKSGVGGQVMLNDKGEIDETPDEVEDEKVVTSQIAYLQMQLEEKRRHIEAEKYRAQAEWEDQRRRLGQTAFWYVIGKAQGNQNVREGTGSEAVHVDRVPHDKPRKPLAEFPNQPSPPIAWSSPANSPLPASVSKPSPSGEPQFETREFRLSDYPPGEDLDFNQDVMRPSSQPAVEVSSTPTPVPPRPSSHDPAASRHTAPARKCWNVDVAQVPTPPPLVYPDTASMSSDTKQERNVVHPPGGGTAEIEVEIHTPSKKGLAMFIGDDAQPTTQGLTPEQERKREKFMRLRQKKQEEDRTRKEAEMEKKRRREEKQREKEMLQKMEEERLRQEELDRQKAEQELRMREAQAARVPDSYSTYRRPGSRQHVYDVDDDSNSYFVPAPAQPSGFAEFSGPQCYVKPSGKSNRKIIVNAISHVCLSGTVNQDQKEKCLQAISESDGHHFMILFKDGLKFRGIYVHNLENDQLFKIFGIGPRVVTSKMLEGLYKYNSGGKEFTKIPSKTLSIAVDGFAIQKSYWQSGKPVVQSKTSSNLKRPPRHQQR